MSCEQESVVPLSERVRLVIENLGCDRVCKCRPVLGSAAGTTSLGKARASSMEHPGLAVPRPAYGSRALSARAHTIGTGYSSTSNHFFENHKAKSATISRRNLGNKVHALTIRSPMTLAKLMSCFGRLCKSSANEHVENAIWEPVCNRLRSDPGDHQWDQVYALRCAHRVRCEGKNIMPIDDATSRNLGLMANCRRVCYCRDTPKNGYHPIKETAQLEAPGKEASKGQGALASRAIEVRGNTPAPVRGSQEDNKSSLQKERKIQDGQRKMLFLHGKDSYKSMTEESLLQCHPEVVNIPTFRSVSVVRCVGWVTCRGPHVVKLTPRTPDEFLIWCIGVCHCPQPEESTSRTSSQCFGFKSSRSETALSSMKALGPGSYEVSEWKSHRARDSEVVDGKRELGQGTSSSRGWGCKSDS